MGRLSYLATQLVTNTLKLGGLVVAGNELLLRKDLRPAALAEAAFMMAGGQFSEHVLTAVLDRLLGRAGLQPDQAQESPDLPEPHPSRRRATGQTRAKGPRT